MRAVGWTVFEADEVLLSGPPKFTPEMSVIPDCVAQLAVAPVKTKS